jgi:hypothetical protein
LQKLADCLDPAVGCPECQHWNGYLACDQNKVSARGNQFAILFIAACAHFYWAGSQFDPKNKQFLLKPACRERLPRSVRRRSLGNVH